MLRLRVAVLLAVLAAGHCDDDDDDEWKQEGWEVQDWTSKFQQAQQQQGHYQHTNASSISDLLDDAEELEEQEEKQSGGGVAYLFLARAGLPLEQAWQAYFSTCPPGSYKALVHQQSGGGTSLNTVPQVGVVMGDLRFKYDMVRAMWSLLHHSMKDTDTQWFHFLSDGCLPVRRCDELHEYLSTRSGSSFVGNMPMANQAELASTKRCFNGARFSQPCYKSSQWVTLFRAHATSLLTTHVPNQQDFWAQTFVPDEHLIPTVLSQNRMPVTGHVLTYTKWPGKLWPEPAAWRDAGPQDVDCPMAEGSHPCQITLMDTHVQKPSANFFFARKITPEMWQQSPAEAAAIIQRLQGAKADLQQIKKHTKHPKKSKHK